MYKYAGILSRLRRCCCTPCGACRNDAETCDRLAAFPDDPDKPAGVAGNYHIPRPDIATVVKACKAAAGTADAPRRLWFELGRAYEFSHQPAEALRAYRKAIDMGSTTAMVGHRRHVCQRLGHQSQSGRGA